MKKLLLFIFILCPLLSCSIAHKNYLTIGGEGRPEWKKPELSLQAKAQWFEQDLANFISPFGTLMYVHKYTGGFAYSSSADVCMWTGTLLGAQALRFACTKDEDAKQKIKILLTGLETLHRITGVHGLFARNAVPSQGPGVPVPEGGIWYSGSGEFQGWRWKGDVSKDQYSGLVFGLTLTYLLAEDVELKQRAANLAKAIADHFMEHDFYITDPHNRPTTYGNVRARMYGLPIGVNALISLGALKLAAVSNSDSRYGEMYWQKIADGWAEQAYWAKFQIFGITNHNNDNMAFLMYYSLLMMEQDPNIREEYLASLQRTWSYVYREGNAFFNYVAAANGAANALALEEAGLTLELFPMDKRNLFIDLRSDARFQHHCFPNRKGLTRAKYPLPINYRSPSSFVWKSCPYELESGEGKGEIIYAGHDYLLAYWLGRYHDFLTTGDA